MPSDELTEEITYYCGIHQLVFTQRDWCPQCEIEYDARERGLV